MLDVETYLITKDNPGGPIVQIKPISFDEPLDEKVTTGVVIGRILGLVLVVGLGLYSYSIF